MLQTLYFLQKDAYFCSPWSVCIVSVPLFSPLTTFFSFIYPPSQYFLGTSVYFVRLTSGPRAIFTTGQMGHLTWAPKFTGGHRSSPLSPNQQAEDKLTGQWGDHLCQWPALFTIAAVPIIYGYCGGHWDPCFGLLGKLRSILVTTGSRHSILVTAGDIEL